MTSRIDQGDFENELRDLFREKAGEAPLASSTLPASAPQQVLRRGRLHQAGTVLGSAVVVVALIIGSVAGLTRILGEGRTDRVGGGDYEVFQRTATVEAFTVTSPSDWYLVNEWPLSMSIAVEGSGGSASACFTVPGDEVQECEDTSEDTPNEATSSPIPVPQGVPMLQLSNVDLGLATNACAGGLPGDAAVLYVALDYDAAIAGIADPSIPEFPPGPGLPPEGDGPCGPGRYAEFTVNGERFFSWIGVGAEASAEDRETVETSYEMMSAIDGWTPTPPEDSTPGYVIAGGTTSAEGPWRLEARPGNEVEMALFIGGTSGRIDVSLGSEPVSWCCTLKTDPSRAADVLFGAVRKDATTVFFRPADERGDISALVLPLPPTLPSDFDLFFIEGTGGLVGDVIALGVDMPSEGPPPVAEPRADEVELAGDAFGQRYRVRFVGGFADDSACIHVTIGGEGSEPLCPRPIATSLAGDQPSLNVVNTADLAVVVGSVPPEVVEIRFTSENGGNTPSQFQCQMGPLGWTDPDRRVCAIALPPDDGGTFEYLDAYGDVLFQDGMGWFVSQGEPVGPTPVDPVHGGTYWAVYPWVGAPGSRAADDVSAQLLAEFGIEAFPGDLSCDDGAAEALGTDAPQGIGVYFESREEANAFALQAAGLFGAGADPVIARVTTYCLD